MIWMAGTAFGISLQELLQFAIPIYDILLGIHRKYNPVALEMDVVAEKIRHFLASCEAADVFYWIILRMLNYCFQSDALQRGGVQNKDPYGLMMCDVIAGLDAFGTNKSWLQHWDKHAGQLIRKQGQAFQATEAPRPVQGRKNTSKFS